MKRFVRKTRWWLYKFGVRPKPGSIWYSPSLSYMYGCVDEWKIKRDV